jgi:hypothetical protein
MITDIRQDYESIFQRLLLVQSSVVVGFTTLSCITAKKVKKLEAQERAKAEAPIKTSSRVAGGRKAKHSPNALFPRSTRAISASYAPDIGERAVTRNDTRARPSGSNQLN